MVKNWWYYHKWYVVLGVLFLVFLVHRMSIVFGWFSVKPDFQIAYVGKVSLSEMAERWIMEQFSELAWDFNGDGQIEIKINQYVAADPSVSGGDSFYYQYASEVEIIGDINSCDSYFFLLDDPEDFQRRFQILAMPDGGAPADTDFGIEGKGIWLSDIMQADAQTKPIADEMPFPETDLFLGRRCFYEDAAGANVAEYDKLWEKLTAAFKIAETASVKPINGEPAI